MWLRHPAAICQHTNAEILSAAEYARAVRNNPLGSPDSKIFPVMINRDSRAIYEAADLITYLREHNGKSPATEKIVGDLRNKGLVVVQRSIGPNAEHVASIGEKTLKAFGYSPSKFYEDESLELENEPSPPEVRNPTNRDVLNHRSNIVLSGNSTTWLELPVHMLPRFSPHPLHIPNPNQWGEARVDGGYVYFLRAIQRENGDLLYAGSITQDKRAVQYFHTQEPSSGSPMLVHIIR